MMYIKIREAIPSDFHTIVNIMNEALSPYYDGDHTAHAERIFNTHISGGKDCIGHFSFEQKIFIASSRSDEILGMINLVGKRQGTFKISPLIVEKKFRNIKGIGSLLLEYAECYAKKQLAREIYCTVAKNNNSAFNFFIKKGYVIAGYSESHYKLGVQETMLYKLFPKKEDIINFDVRNISVIPLRGHHKRQASDLILKILPQYFDGINSNWIEALYDGYERRNTKDVNLKYKLIYVAVDREDNVLGIAGATPKKGKPIKLMPFIAQDIVSFTALLRDVPYILKEYGHKVYLHIVPNVEETIMLQRLGWSLDAAMPAAYHIEKVTQQWSYTLGGNLMRTMRVKDYLLQEIVCGKKTLEVRVGYDNIKMIRIKEKIRLASHVNEQIVIINNIRVYPDFDAMIKNEKPELILPGKNSHQVISLLKDIYPHERESLGVYVFEMMPI